MKNTQKDLAALIKNRVAELAKAKYADQAVKLLEEIEELGDQLVELIRASIKSPEEN
jgi:putative heme degradation protein